VQALAEVQDTAWRTWLTEVLAMATKAGRRADRRRVLSGEPALII